MTRAAGAFAVILLATAAGCAPGGNALEDVPDPQGLVAGFPRGLWHGAIAPVTFVVSLFDRDVGVYETHNIGPWYDVGFLLGLTVFCGGCGGAACAPRRDAPSSRVT